VTDVTASQSGELARRLRAAWRLAAMLAGVLDESASLLEQPPPAPSRGRPRAEPTEAQKRRVLELAAANGRLSTRALRAKTGLSRRVVDRILAEHKVAQKEAKTAQKPSARGPTS
jgi:hypothetical protein